MNLPTPKSVLARAAERLFLVGLVAGLSDLMAHQSLGHTTPALISYFLLKTVIDALNRNVPNV